MKISASLKCYRKKAADFRRLGLTTLGKKFKRTPNYHTQAERIDVRRRKGLESYQRRAALNRLGGLTTRGGNRIYRIRLDDALVVKASVVAALRSIEAEFKTVPERSKPAVLRLANTLAALMKDLEK